MTEATEKGERVAANLPSAGEQLRQAREERNLTIQQVAQALHLDPWILEALEQNRFKDVGAPVFVKGHLRKYASEVGLDDQQLMEAYYRADDTPETPGLVTDTFSRPSGDQHGRWPVIVVGVVVALLIILVAFLWLRGGGMPSFLSFGQQDNSADIQLASEPIAASSSVRDNGVPAGDGGDRARVTETSPAATTTGNSASQITETATIDATSDQSAGAAQERQLAVAAGNPQTTQSQSDDGLVRLSITLENDSWLEIYDARNRRLFFDLARSGSTQNVTGAPPLQVLLGNADDARVRVNGNVWPIPAAARRGKTARFTIR